MRAAKSATLHRQLDEIARTYDRAYLGTDPLKFVHRYEDPRDQEIAGLIAAAFAYGSVVLIFRAVERILGEMGPSPRAFLDGWDAKRDRARFRGFKHRFHDGRDVALLLTLLAQAICAHGDLGSLFARGHDPADPHVGPALARFVGAILGGDPRPFHPSGSLPRSSPVRYLLSSPADGSACKRMLLYLRWMIRPADGLDVGIWSAHAPASKLVIPLDTHTFRAARKLGLTARKQGNWKAAEEVTAALRAFDPTDPVRYDFALCRVGMLRRRMPK